MKIWNKVVAALGAMSMIGFTACACPNANLAEEEVAALEPTEEDQACAAILEQIKVQEKQLKMDALAEGIEVKIESSVDHCRLLEEPYEDAGVLLLSADIWQDGEYQGQQGVLFKFVKVGSEWTILSAGTYYFQGPEAGEEDGGSELDQ